MLWPFLRVLRLRHQGEIRGPETVGASTFTGSPFVTWSTSDGSSGRVASTVSVADWTVFCTPSVTESTTSCTAVAGLATGGGGAGEVRGAGAVGAGGAPGTAGLAGGGSSCVCRVGAEVSGARAGWPDGATEPAGRASCAAPKRVCPL